MAFAIDPHQAFSDRLSRVLRRRDVPATGCSVNQVWRGYCEAAHAYALWPTERTAHWCCLLHTEGPSGPVTQLTWLTYFEHVNLKNQRTRITFTELSLTTPLLIAVHAQTLTVKSTSYSSLSAWCDAVRNHAILRVIAADPCTWRRALRVGTLPT